MRSTVKGENLLIGEQILPLTVDPHCEGGWGWGGGQSSRVASSKSLHITFILLLEVQLTLVISTSVISNNPLSRRENLIPV